MAGPCSQKFFAGLDLNLYPVNDINVFSKINTVVNEDRTSTTSHTVLSGFGWSLGLSGGRSFKLKVMGQKITPVIPPLPEVQRRVIILADGPVIIVNQSSGSVDTSTSSGSVGFSAVSAWDWG